VATLEGPRHRLTSPESLRAAEDYVAAQLSLLGLPVERRPFQFDGQTFENIVATKAGSRPERPRVLVGAHVDSVATTPGADDNASGVAALLEAARLLTPHRLAATVELVGFNLEEQQGLTYMVGSRALAREARSRGIEYAGVLVLEMVGYTSALAGSQGIPWPLRWRRLPRSGNFLAVVGSTGSRRLLDRFVGAAQAAVPELPVVTHCTPFRGWLVPQTRLSDNAAFWDRGYPALMVTDTAFLRNPHYHRGSDRLETLDFEFMARVVRAVVAAVRVLAGEDGGLTAAGGPPLR
jgi:Zn-dependent M28 family amino/carboxypeptidase